MLKIFLKTVLTLSFILMSQFIQGQTQPSAEHITDHKPLMNETWETFDLLMYKVETKNGTKTYTPYFPPALEELSGKQVTIQGYLIPLQSGFRHNRFLLSVLPIHQCMFCGTDGIPAMVEVTLANNKKERISEKPIRIRGKVVLNGTDRTRVEILLDQSEKI